MNDEDDERVSAMEFNALNICKDIQHMIELNSEHLQTLRTSVPMTSDLTKQEIRTLEGKLIKLFSRQLSLTMSGYSKSTSSYNQYPHLSLWCNVVGVSLETRSIILSKVDSLHSLKDKSSEELKNLLQQSSSEDFRKLSLSLNHLKKTTESFLSHGSKNFESSDLYWDSWNESSISSDTRGTPPTTPPWTSISSTKNLLGTPPSVRQKTLGGVTSNLEYSISKSHSNESDLSNRLESAYPIEASSPKSPLSDSGAIVFDNNLNSLTVPKSPRTPRSMGHVIRHRFKKTLKPGKCAICHEYMFNGLRCKECKYKCHRDCESNVPPSCGLPDPLVAYYMNHYRQEDSPNLPSKNYNQTIKQSGGNLHLESSNSNSNTSSCNSSSPSSPAVMVTSSQPTPPSSASSFSYRSHFRFPDPISSSLVGNSCPPPLLSSKISSHNPLLDTVKSYDSDKTLSGNSVSSGSVGTSYRLDSQDSTTSVDECSSWIAQRQTSISLREWDINYEEIKIGDKIGSGRFSTVHQGNWHGDVAIKILNMENLEDEHTLESFRLDVATFRKTRHENLILFMGACMNPPKLAIVTSLCKGNTLYTHLHLRKDKFQMNRLIQIAEQISQGMGYLHHRGIVHKDLKTKNIFLEKGKAVITDFGLVNVADRLCARHVIPSRMSPFPSSRSSPDPEYMSIPEGWLCYLAPEIMRNLRVQPNESDLPFQKASDIFAFGTLWYELLTMEWPWKNQSPETTIWMVGKGMKPSLSHLQASKDVKEILINCWTFKSEERPNFTELSSTLNAIPKKRLLIRSPSHPLHLSRSAESVF